MKTYEIVMVRRGRERVISGTMKELLEYFSYTLEVGKSWEHEKGNKKINLNPKTGERLVDALNKASNNSARDGCGSEFYYLNS